MTPMEIRQKHHGVKEVGLLSSGNSMNAFDSMLNNVRQKHQRESERVGVREWV